MTNQRLAELRDRTDRVATYLRTLPVRDHNEDAYVLVLELLDALEAAQSARRAEREEERQAVVAWLERRGDELDAESGERAKKRSTSWGSTHGDHEASMARAMEAAAEAIEQGEHLGAEPHRQDDHTAGLSDVDAFMARQRPPAKSAIERFADAHGDTAGLSDVAAKALLYDEARRLLELHRTELMEHAALANLLPADGGRAVAYKAAAGHVVALELVLDDPATLARLREEHRVIQSAAEVAHADPEEVRAELEAARADSEHEVGSDPRDWAVPVIPGRRYRELRAAVVGLRDYSAACRKQFSEADPNPKREGLVIAHDVVVRQVDAILARFPEVE